MAMHKQNLLLAISLIVCVSIYGADADADLEAQSRIIGGTNVPTSQFPTVGETGGDILGLGYDQFFCTGTLIGSKYVVTAGHCVFLGGDHPLIADTEGRFRLGGKIYKTKRIYVHSTFKGDASFLAEGNFDVSIWELDTPVVGVTPTPLFRSTPTVGTLLTIAGYGLVGEGAYGINDNSLSPPEGTIEFGTTTLETVTATFLKWIFDEKPSPNDEANTAPGDSGGPAFINVSGTLQLAAVTTGGSNFSAAFGDRSFDTRLDPIVSWIDRVISGLPANDAFVDPIPLYGTVVSDSISNVGATKETGESNHGGNAGGASIWWSWTAPSSGTVTLSTAGSDFDTLLAVYQGKGVSALTLVAQNDDHDSLLTSSLTFSSVAGKTYRIAVDGANGNSGNVKISLALQGAADLVVSLIESDPLLPYPGEDVTFTVTLYNKGTADATCNVAFWPHRTTEPTLNDVTPYNDTAYIPAGEKYILYFDYTVADTLKDATAWFYVDHFVRVSEVAESNEKNNTLSYGWTVNNSLLNDNFALPIVLPSGDTTSSATNANATQETGEPNHAGKTGGRSIWWKWTANTSGLTHVSTSGSSFDTLLAIYTGDSVSALTVVASNDDKEGELSSTLAFYAVAGKTYSIAIDGVNKSFGRAVLDIQGAEANPLNIKQAQLRFNFKATGKDSLTLSGDLDVLTAFASAKTKTCSLLVGNFQYDFTLDENYKSKNKGIRFNINKSATATFSLKLKDLDLLTKLSDLGFSNANVKDSTVSVPVTLLLSGENYTTTLSLTYNAKAKSGGQAK